MMIGGMGGRTPSDDGVWEGYSPVCEATQNLEKFESNTA